MCRLRARAAPEVLRGARKKRAYHARARGARGGGGSGRRGAPAPGTVTRFTGLFCTSGPDGSASVSFNPAAPAGACEAAAAAAGSFSARAETCTARTAMRAPPNIAAFFFF
jgi:hypothetical protein